MFYEGNNSAKYNVGDDDGALNVPEEGVKGLSHHDCPGPHQRSQPRRGEDGKTQDGSNFFVLSFQRPLAPLYSFTGTLDQDEARGASPAGARPTVRGSLPLHRWGDIKGGDPR